MVGGGRVKSEALLRLLLVWRLLFRRSVVVFTVKENREGGVVECGVQGSWSAGALVQSVGVLAHMTMTLTAERDGEAVPTITAADLEAAEAVSDLLKNVGGADGSQG